MNVKNITGTQAKHQLVRVRKGKGDIHSCGPLPSVDFCRDIIYFVDRVACMRSLPTIGGGVTVNAELHLAWAIIKVYRHSSV